MPRAPPCRPAAASTAYSTQDRYGDIAHQYDSCGRHQTNAVTRSACGPWDFGPTTGDFAYMYKSHPTETVFNKSVSAFGKEHTQKHFAALNGPASSRYSEGPDPGPPQQFRRPDNAKAALMSSTIIMPYKKGGRRKAGDDNHWKAVCTGATRPVWCKGPEVLLDCTEHLQVHPLHRGEHGGEFQNIHKSCSALNLAAGTPTGTCPKDNLQRSHTLGHLEERHSTLMASHLGSTMKTLPGMPGGPSVMQSLRCPVRRALGGAVPGLALRTVSTRDPDAAGHGGCGGHKKLPLDMQ